MRAWWQNSVALQAGELYPLRQTAIACMLSLPVLVCYLLLVLHYLCANLVTAEELTFTVIILLNLGGVQRPI